VEVSQVIADDDEMCIGEARQWYFGCGESGLDVVRKITALGRRTEFRQILDLPCGHGRVGRYLRAAYPDAEMTFCDLNESGVRFCETVLGGRGIVSRPELSEVRFDTPFDLIWIGSLFTHVDAERTERWLRHLCSALAPDGVLVATFHGYWSREVQKIAPLLQDADWARVVDECDRSGFGYAPYDAVASPDYGVSLAKPHRIVEMAERIPGVRMLAYLERGWAGNHDVLGIAKTDRFEPW
jgi:SAM-dependent methyltransferase